MFTRKQDLRDEMNEKNETELADVLKILKDSKVQPFSS